MQLQHTTIDWRADFSYSVSFFRVYGHLKRFQAFWNDILSMDNMRLLFLSPPPLVVSPWQSEDSCETRPQHSQGWQWCSGAWWTWRRHPFLPNRSSPITQQMYSYSNEGDTIWKCLYSLEHNLTSVFFFQMHWNHYISICDFHNKCFQLSLRFFKLTGLKKVFKMNLSFSYQEFTKYKAFFCSTRFSNASLMLEHL